MSDERYFLSQDNDAHWYIVPIKRLAEWDKWRAINTDDERAWEVPEFAREVGGAPSLVSFNNPEIDR